MNLFDKIVYLSIALLYNIFIHYLVNILYKDLTYDDKFEYSSTFIFVAGIFGIVVSKLVCKDSYTDSVMSMGFGIGGLLLVLTAFLVNWTTLTDQIKLLISFIFFILFIWYAYKYDNKKTNSYDNTH